ncbi:Uncharacterised protein [Yersinia aldovae]|uniref:hypothetical protein n=1 Tax=Yersinia aldovae TaxID=29483 RepID=UPI0005E9FAF2|nr:hypothetical protein [Yersinia aldovae]CNK26138.1 Uncharacterised protein [Yersinia aldovae]
MSRFDDLKDAKIAEILEDYLALEKKIDEIPQRLESSLSLISEAVSELPDQLDAKLNDKIQAIISVAENAESEAKNASKTIIKELKDEAEIIKLEAIKALYTVITKEVEIGIKGINEAAKKIEGLAKAQNQSITPVLITGLLCALLSVGGAFVGTMIWNKTFLDKAHSELILKDKALNASIAGFNAVIESLPAQQAKKVNDIYLDAADKSLKK